MKKGPRNEEKAYKKKMRDKEKITEKELIEIIKMNSGLPEWYRPNIITSSLTLNFANFRHIHEDCPNSSILICFRSDLSGVCQGGNWNLKKKDFEFFFEILVFF